MMADSVFYPDAGAMISIQTAKQLAISRHHCGAPTR